MQNLQKIKCGRGLDWEIDMQRLAGFLNGCAYSEAFREHAKLARTEDDWMQKLGLAPDSAQIDWDDSQVAASKTRIFNKMHVDFYVKFAQVGTAGLMFLAQQRAKRQLFDCERNKLFSSAQAINSNNVKWATKAIGYARGTRDFSVMSLGVIATVSTGGTVTFFMAGALASTGKGVTVYQDQSANQKDLAKALTAGGLQAITLGSGTLLKAAGAAGTVKAGLTLLIGAGADTAEEWYVDGKELETALARAGVGVAFGAAGETAAAGKLKTLITRNLAKAHGIIGPRGAKLITANAVETLAGVKIGNAPAKDVTEDLVFGLASKQGENTIKGLIGADPSAGGGGGASPQAASCQPADLSASMRFVLGNIMRPRAAA